MIKEFANTKWVKGLYYFVLPATILLIYCALILKFFPNGNGKLGHDYALFFPHLLDGAIWFNANGIWQVPWFTPSWGGGLPKFPNPQSMYYSVPQFLCFITDPLTSIKLTIVLFAGLGFTGFYTLLKRNFNTSYIIAITGATLFLFNGFFFHRMVVGHITYHSFMLLPWLTYLVISIPKNTYNYITQIVLASIILSYAVYSGAFHLLPIMVLAIISIMVIYHLNSQSKILNSFIKLGLIGLVTLSLSASLLSASIFYISNFPRDFYPLPGIASFFGLLKVIFLSIFSEAPWDLGNSLLSKNIGGFGQHEFEYGITFLPVLLLVTGVYLYVKNQKWRNDKSRTPLYGLLLLISVVPILLNIYTPSWNLFLKEIPFIKSSSILLRWIAFYIPLIILLATLSLSQLTPSSIKRYLSLVVISSIIFLNYSRNRDDYHYDSYNPKPIVDAFLTKKEKPGITHIYLKDNSNNLTGNDLVVSGLSQIEPYESIFGYNLETFPKLGLTEGSVFNVDSRGYYNCKNPASYVFPIQNNLEIGEHFKEKNKVEDFTAYKPFHFEMSIWQRVANTITILALLLSFGFLIYIVMRNLKKLIS